MKGLCRLFALFVLLLVSSVLNAAQLTQLSVSTSTGVETIEPALDDYVTVQWQAREDEQPPASVVFLQETPHGTIADPATSKKYTQVGEAALADVKSVAEARWPDKSQPVSEIPAARLRIGVNLPGGKRLFSDRYVTIAPTLSELGTGLELHLDHGRSGDSGIYYRLSTAVSKCTFVTHDGKVQGNTKAGYYAFLGALRTPVYQALGVDPIKAFTDPACGPRLSITGMEFWVLRDGKRMKYGFGDYSESEVAFCPGDGDRLEIRFRVCEPVKRLHASKAYLTVYLCYKETPQIEALVADRLPVEIDNDPTDGKDTGWNSIIWDGRDPAGKVVYSESMGEGLTFYARDDAGVGCESGLQRADLRIAESENLLGEVGMEYDPESKGMLMWARPGDTISWSEVVAGVTVASGKGTADTSGMLLVRYIRKPGIRVFRATASAPGKPDIHGTSQLGEVELVSKCGNIGTNGTYSLVPYDRNTFCPDKGQKVKIDFSANVDCRVSLSVAGDSTYCRLQGNLPFYTLGDSYAKNVLCPDTSVIREYEAKKGLNSITWDGRDDQGNLVPPGVYGISVTTASGNGFETHAVVKRVDRPDLISGIKVAKGSSLAISWQSAVPTTGALVEPYKMHYVIHPSTSHTIRVPAGDSDGSFCAQDPRMGKLFWIVAEDANGRIATAPVIIDPKISSAKAKGDEPYTLVDEARVEGASQTSARVTWRTVGAAFGRVRYAKVDGAVKDLKWLTASESKAGKVHSITIKNLALNSDYIIEVQSAKRSTFDDAQILDYEGICTKLGIPDVKILSPSWKASVPETFDMVVQASDSVHRREGNGISRVCLSEVANGFGSDIPDPEHIPGTDRYVFHIDPSKLKPGIRVLRVDAYDEYGNGACCTTVLYIGCKLPAVDGATAK